MWISSKPYWVHVSGTVAIRAQSDVHYRWIRNSLIVFASSQAEAKRRFERTYSNPYDALIVSTNFRNDAE